MGAIRRAIGVSRPLRRALQARTVALRLGRNSSAASAGTTSTARARSCKSRPTATTRKPASSGTRSATPAQRIKQYVDSPAAQRAVLLSRAHRVGPALLIPLGRRAREAAQRPSPCSRQHHLERLQQFRRPQQLHQRRRAAGHADRQLRARNCRAISDAEFGTWGYPAYAPLSFDRPEPINDIALDEQHHRSDRRPAGVPPRAGRMAAARLAGTRRLRLRPLRRARSSTTARSICRSIACSSISTHPEYWTRRMYDRVKQLGLRGRRPADVPRRQRPQLRSRANARRRDVRPQRRDHEPLAFGNGWQRKPIRHAPRVGGELAGRCLHASGGNDRRAVSRDRGRSLGLRRHRPEGTATSSARSVCTNAARAAPVGTRRTRSLQARRRTCIVWPRA